MHDTLTRTYRLTRGAHTAPETIDGINSLLHQAGATTTDRDRAGYALERGGIYAANEILARYGMTVASA